LYTRFIPFGHAAGAFSLPFSLLSCTRCHPALFLPFSQLYPTAPGGICEMKRWNPYPSKKGMNQKSPPLQESFRMSFTQTVLQHHQDCKVENTAAMPTLTGAADAADIFMRG
jgi:hypothetical protein